MAGRDLTRAVLTFSAALCFTALATTPGWAQSFVAFESGPVRPLAMSPNGTRLFAVNTPDNRLEIFDIFGGTLVHSESVAVGLEPVAVAARSNNEVWVVNHLSDSVSVVDVAASPPQVTRTLLVGDEPRDIVFANGSAGQRAYITTARRGQNSPVAANLTTPGIGRALVWAFDPANLGTSLTGTPLSIIELFGDTPRALAVSPDGNTVYAAVFHSGNQTTTISEGGVCDGGAGAPACSVFGFTMPGGLPAPNTNFAGTPQPETGLIVKFDPGSGQWRDELNRNWNNYVRFSLPDYDVFTISNNTLAATGNIPGVGTINFNMAVNPLSGKVYVSNTEAINEVRFEGPGTYVTNNGFKPVGEPASVIGHLHEARISIIDNLGNVTPRHLNKHINYAAVPSPAGTRENSLATPLDMAVTSNVVGQKLYVAAFGSQKVGVFDVAQLENNTFVPSSANHIALSGGGPSGVVLDEANNRLYVATRFDNSISVINTLTNTEIAHLPTYNPEPANIVDGRPVLYDAFNTSSNGEASCSSCHVFGDFDSLAWDLGNPDDILTTNNLPLPSPLLEIGFKDFHPLKGPMTTQTLRGMATHGALHWRGDRSVGHFGNSPTDEVLSFNNFIVAFEGLLGHNGLIPDAEMFKFTDFMLDVVLPPNPNRPLDNQLVGAAANGASVYNGPISDTVFNCNGCHELNPAVGHFGANGKRSFENETQHFKIAHLSNVYQKVGMFGMARVPFLSAGNNGDQGPQIRGFGMLHDGGIDTVFRFLGATVFTLTTTQRSQLEQFIFQFPTTYAPIVGQQTTLTATNGGTVGSRIDLLIARAKACFTLMGMPGVSECELVVKGTSGGAARGWLGELQGPCGPAQTILFQGDRASDPLLTDAQLRALASGSDRLTYTCVPPGSGERIALDRDEDGYFDRDELDAGSDPANPLSIPGGTAAATLVSSKKILVKDDAGNNESKRKMVILGKDAAVAIPVPGSADDPTCNGDPSGTVKVSLTVSSTSSGQVHRTDLPCQNWTLLGTPASPKGYKYKDKELDDGTVKAALWKSGKLKLVVQGKGTSVLDYDLISGVSQNTVDAVLVNDGGNICLACPPSNGKDGSDGKKFLGKSCAAPAVCGAI
jgi:YVTN family beta-propeller protein